MRRNFALSLLVLVLFTACAKKSDLEPQEVLRQSAEAVKQLQSSNFVVNGDLSTPKGMNFTVKADGILQQAGKQFQFTVNLHGTYLNGAVTHTVDALADVAVAGDNEVYFRLRSFSVTPEQTTFSPEMMGEIAGSWWKLPTDGGGTLQTISPDPQLPQLQSKVLSVTEDLGIQELNNRDAYRYKVRMDPVKLVDFLQASAAASGEPFSADTAQMIAGLFSGAGELWVDKETMFVHRLAWEFLSTDASLAFTSHLNIELSKYNAAPAIVFPTDAKPWKFGSVATGSTFPIQQSSSRASSSASSRRAASSQRSSVQ